MTPLATPVFAVAAVLVVIAALTDLRWRSIPNWLSLGAIVLGLAMHTWLTHWQGLWFSAKGLGLAALIFLPLFILRWLGGGDVKLMGAVGALAGAGNLFVIFLFDSIFGGIVALVVILLKKRGGKTLDNIDRAFHAMAKGKAPYQESQELEAGSEQSLGLPRAVTIALATLLVLWAGRV